MRQIVVLDTSALLSVFEEKLNIDSQLRGAIGECDIVVPSAVMAELEAMSGARARGAAGLSARYGSFSCTRKGDDGVLEAALNLGAYAVVTNDAGLADRLIAQGIRVLRLSGRKKFAFYRSDEVQ